jgi:magnesium transporter
MEAVEINNFRWINLTKPSVDNISYLRDTYHFHELNLEDCLSTIQRPKIDVQKDYMFIVLHFPKFRKDLRRMTVSEVNIFLGKDYIITSGSGDLKPLASFFKEQQRDPKELEKLIKKGSGMLLYEIIDRLFEYCFPIVDKVSERLSSIGDVLFDGKSSKVVSELAKINQEIIILRRVINPEIAVIKDLDAKIKPFLANVSDLYFDDIIDAVEKIWYILESLKEVSESLQRTYDSFITFRLNEIMRVLTVFSAIMLPLTVITGFYGMNVNGLPMSDMGWAAEMIVAIMVLISGSMLYFFYRKKFI